MWKSLISRYWQILLWIGIILACVLLGFYLSRNGLHIVDDAVRYKYSQWLLYKYGLLPSEPDLSGLAKWYGPLWDFILGITTELLLPWMHDPYWVRHALTLSLFPITLVFTFVLLRKAQVQRSTALLAVAMLYGTIRFGGFTLSTKDFPPAAAYLLISIYLWVRLRSEQERWSTLRWRTIVELTIVSLIPFLIRPPLLLHFALVVTIVGLYAAAARGKPLWKRCLMAAAIASPARICHETRQ